MVSTKEKQAQTDLVNDVDVEEPYIASEFDTITDSFQIP